MRARGPSDEFIPTRRSLLNRLKNWDDQESWRDFFNTYWRLLYSVALKARLTESEAQDAVQETLISVAKSLPGLMGTPQRHQSAVRPRPSRLSKRGQQAAAR